MGVPHDVAIVGGGLAGLTVAYRLRIQRPDLRVIVLESTDRLGGKLRTEQVEHPAGPFFVESGPDCFLAQKPWARELAEELGLSSGLVPINQMRRPVSLLKHGRIVDLPSGVSLLAPTEFFPFLRSPLISPAGKARIALDLVLRTNALRADESIATFVRRRLGQEALDWIAEPLMAGIYSADPEELSLLATFPNLRDLERTHGSVIRGLRSVRRPRTGHHPPPAPFLTLRAGMQTLVDRLAREIENLVQLEAKVDSLSRTEAGYDVGIEGRAPIHARTAILAVPSAVAANLVAPFEPGAGKLLSRFRTASSGTISIAFHSAAIHGGPPGYGLVIPAKEGRPFNAITIASLKFPYRAPAGWTLLRLFFGGARSPATMRTGDDDLKQLALTEVNALFGILEEPAFVSIARWPIGNPIYDVGHVDRLQEIERGLPQDLLLVGSAYRGVGIPDVIRDANEIAGRVAETASRRAQKQIAV